LRAVVSGDNFHPWRQARLELIKARLDRSDGREGILAGAQHNDTADHFAFAVELGDAAAHFRPVLDPRDVAQQDRNTGLARSQDDVADVVEGFEVTARADHVLGLAQLDDRAAGFTIGPLQRARDLRQRQVEGDQLVRVDDDLELPDHATDARNLGHIRDGLQLVLEKPVLQRAKLGDVLRAGPVHQRVFVYPAHASRVRPERDLGARRQSRLHLIEVFEDAGAGPIRVVPSSNSTYTNASPKNEKPRTTFAPGTDNMVVVSGKVTWSSTICGAWPGYWTRRITCTSDRSGNASSGACNKAHRPHAPSPQAASSTSNRLPTDQRMRWAITVDLHSVRRGRSEWQAVLRCRRCRGATGRP
jgi:hypothetical protein